MVGRGPGRRGIALVVAALACGDESPPPAPAPEPQPVPSAAEVHAELEGMRFDAFLERSFEILLQRSPMTVIELGLEDRIDVGERFLGDAFDPIAFHRAVLTHGSVPLDVLDSAVAADLALPARPDR